MHAAKTLELVRNDVLQTAATRRGTLVVFPSSAHKQQKIGTGDLSGVVQCFSVKGQDIKTSFKSLPTRQSITTVALGHGTAQRDRMFFAEDAVVRGMTKKGKEFFRFDTNLTESISGLFVQDTLLAVMGEYVCVVFEDHREKSFYMSPDRLNAFDAWTHEGKLAIALACQDRRIRILEGSNVVHQIALQGVATCVVHVPESHDPLCRYPEARELLYGTENGIVGQLLLDSAGLHEGFAVGNPEGHSCVTAIYAGIDFTLDGLNDIAVGRDDGRIEIYSVDETGVPYSVFEVQLPNRINTLAGGCITSPYVQDLIAQTYAGRVIAYTKNADRWLTDPARGSRISGEQRQENTERLEFLETRIHSMKTQVGALAQQLKQKKHVVRHVLSFDVFLLCREQLGFFLDASLDMTMDIKHRCRLDASQNCFVLTIESEKPIFCIGVCCDVEIELMSPINSVAIMSVSPPDAEHGYPVLATFRCQESANRLDVRFRACEGRPGCMTCFVLPKTSTKLAVLLRHRILPLCLHECIPEASPEKGSLMRIRGEFTDEELCLWLAAALPDFPKRWQSDGLLLFRNTQSNQIMRFGKLENGAAAAEIECPDICALNVLRETLLHEASKRNHTLNVELKIDVDGVRHSLECLWSEIETFRDIDARASLGKALAEIQQQVERSSHVLKQRSPTHDASVAAGRERDAFAR